MRNNQRGFTLVEIIVALGIIGLLTSVVTVSVLEARQKGRDAKRLNDVEQLALATRLYAEQYDTYAIVGSGLGCDGWGWVTGSAPGYCGTSIGEELVNVGLLPTVLADPLVPADQVTNGDNTQYALYFLDGGTQVGACVFAKLEAPTTAQLAQYTAIRARTTNTTEPDTNNMNYAVCTS